MLRGHLRLTDVTGVVHFHGKTHVAPLAEVVNAQSPPGLCGLVGKTPRPPLAINIFRRGGRGEAAGRINEGTLSIRDRCVVNSGAPTVRSTRIHADHRAPPVLLA
jgi:hypothetical protein